MKDHRTRKEIQAEVDRTRVPQLDPYRPGHLVEPTCLCGCGEEIPGDGTAFCCQTEANRFEMFPSQACAERYIAARAAPPPKPKRAPGEWVAWAMRDGMTEQTFGPFRWLEDHRYTLETTDAPCIVIRDLSRPMMPPGPSITIPEEVKP